jgi:maltooligosyltrehalose trehalohydrolase
MMGERLTGLIPFEGLKLAAGLVILSPFIPLLFMGEEYGETAPFLYFVDHSDPILVEAVRAGRREEFATFGWAGDPPDPQDEATFAASKLRRHLRNEGQHTILMKLYEELIRLRKTLPSLRHLSKETLEAEGYEVSGVLFLRRWNGGDEAAMIFHLRGAETNVDIPLPRGNWSKVLDTAQEQWKGPGTHIRASLPSDGEVSLALPPMSFQLFVRNREF